MNNYLRCCLCSGGCIDHPWKCLHHLCFLSSNSDIAYKKNLLSLDKSGLCWPISGYYRAHNSRDEKVPWYEGDNDKTERNERDKHTEGKKRKCSTRSMDTRSNATFFIKCIGVFSRPDFPRARFCRVKTVASSCC